MAHDDFDDFFSGAAGEFVPTAKFTNDTGPEGRTQVGGKIVGEILSMAKQDQRKFGTGEPIPDGKGGNKQELKIVLQTEHRNWDKCAKVPVDKDEETGKETPRPESEDDGKRAIYVRGWMTGAIGDAVAKATGKPGGPKIGAKLGVKITELVPTDQGNPYAKYAAVYTAPEPKTDDMFAEGQAKAAEEQAKAPQSMADVTPDAGDEPPF
jgi:hypothetical protein